MMIPKVSEWLAKFKYKVNSATIVKSDAYVTIMMNMAQVTSGVFFNMVTVNENSYHYHAEFKCNCG